MSDPAGVVRKSGSVVRRSIDRVVKVDPQRDHDLRFEAAALDWLRSNGVPTPEVIEVDANRLVTRPVGGRLADGQWSSYMVPTVLRELALLAARIHALPVDEFVPRRSAAALIENARRHEGVLDDLDPERHDLDRRQLVERMVSIQPTSETLVVTHGDLSLSNILLDPSTAALVGVLDAGRLGAADKWLDLAVLTRQLESRDRPWWGGRRAVDDVLETYGAEFDESRCEFYRIVDEFY